MNWKNVLFLVQVERKSGRLIRGIKATRYRENSFLAYWPYWTAAIIGVLGGFAADYLVSIVYSGGQASGLEPLHTAALTFFQQIQVTGKASSQVMYWLPVTWEEHTMASILASLLGWPAAVIVGLSS